MAMKISDEQLSAYLDGELSPEVTADIEKALQKDTTLQTRLEKLSQADALWQDAVGAMQVGSVPSAVMDLLKDEKEVSPVNDNQMFKKWITPIAASVAFAFGLTFQSFTGSGPDSFDGRLLAGQIQSESPLFAMLEQTPSTQSVPLDKSGNLTAKPVLTFATADGSYCREYIVGTQTSATRNVACRGTDSWEVLITSRTRPSLENEYQTVSAETDQSVDMLVDAIIDGLPLDKDAEQTLLQSTWKKN